MKSVHLTLIIIVIYAVSMQSAYGQRIYADKQDPDHTLLIADVIDPDNAVDEDTTNFSILNVSIGLLGAVGTATQNLQFTGAIKPDATAPLMIRFGSGGSVLGLIDGIEVQRTNGGIGDTIGDPYSAGNLLDLLGLIGSEDPSDVTVPIPAANEPSDGVQIKLSAIVGIGSSVNLYYAFFITPPTIEFLTISVCEGEPALISISNYQSGYTYKVYDALTEGNLIYSDTQDVLSLPVENLTSGTYYLEAVEGGTEFTSSRTPFDIVIYPKPGYPDINLNVNLN